MNRQIALDDAHALLRNWRENNVRESTEWERMLYENSLPEELWENDKDGVIKEQMFIALVDIHSKQAARFLYELRQQFGDSSLRVKRLEAINYETNGDYDAALKVYDYIIHEDENNSIARKRKIAVYKAMGDFNRYLSELEKYLKTYMSDSEAWTELSEAYTARENFAKAAFCWEEIILSNPNSNIHFQRYGDIKYSQGGYENVELARSYYVKAITLNPDNMRAMFGLLLACAYIISHPKCNVSRKKDASKLMKFISCQIKIRYAERGDPTAKTVISPLLCQQ